MALFKNKLIPDPYFATWNEDSQWIENKVWTYEKEFQFKKKKTNRYFLKLGGLTPRGEVYLNGRLLGKVEGMFAQPLWEITEILRNGGNRLMIRIEPERERTRAIACQMSYGWDFAPRIIPLGIWRPLEIITSRDVLLKYPFLKLEKLQGKSALLALSLNYDSKFRGRGKIIVTLKGQNFREEFKLEREAKIDEGEGELSLRFSLPNPRLWYPIGYGQQNLYEVSLSFYIGKLLSHSLSFTWGARKLEWEGNPGSSELYGWIPKVNGIRIYCKGANWVPIDSLFDLSPEKYKRFIKLAQLAGINILRIWGGGIIEEDILYEMCDKYGIMLWQEFPLACADYPQLPKEAFLQNARDGILRLRNHPSLVLWCGGNEFDPDNQSNKPLVDALYLLCQTLDGTRPFHRASPYGGDVHDWSVWHGSAPYINYRQFCVFRSEAGLQSPPIKEDLVKFISPKALFPPSGEWSYHHANVDKIEAYARSCGPIKDLEDFLKKAQLLQAIAYQFNLDSCLKNIWANSGCLIWQFNDPWPNISWSMVDWYGNPKPSFYWFKSASQPINLAIDYDKTQLSPGERINIRVYAINLTQKAEERAVVFLIASANRLLKRLNKEHIFLPQQAEKLWDFSYQVPRDYEEGVIFLIVKVMKDKRLIVDKVYPVPIASVGNLSQPIKVLVILSSMGREAEEWRAIGEKISPWGIKLDIASADALPPLGGYDCFVIGESQGIGEKLKRERIEEIAKLVREGKGLLLDGGWFAYAEGGLKDTLLEELSPLTMNEDSLREKGDWEILVKEREHTILKGLSFKDLRINGYNEERAKPDARILLGLSNGAPLLVESVYGKGHCLAYTSGLRGGWSGNLRIWENSDIFITRLLTYLSGHSEGVGRMKQELRGLDNLKTSKLRIRGERKGQDIHLFIRNVSPHIAFFIKVEVEGLSSQPLFSNDYFSLLPGEEKEVNFSLPQGKRRIRVSDWRGTEAVLIL